ncbi:hypothetical protein ID866_9804 [Astraeus odoratus]|nr:hypothetical protein ID866_9804 [Astraeus odoratus]
MTTRIPAGFQSLPLPTTQLCLAAVLKCGQSFRWTSYPLEPHPTNHPSIPTHEYRLCLRDRVVCLRQTDQLLLYRCVFPGEDLAPEVNAAREAETLTWIKDYFQLDVDLLQLYNDWSERDPVFRNLQSRFPGIRILRQDPWENLVSFICSSNNNIPRITKMVHALCENYSTPLLSLPLPSPVIGSASEGIPYYPFPPPSALAPQEVASQLRSLGFGYRADFIQRTARMLIDEHGSAAMVRSIEPSEKWLMSLRDIETATAREHLLKFTGVGRKVADCVLLMSLDKAWSLDTHVHQIAVKHYGLSRLGGSKAKATVTPTLYEEISNRLNNVWGNYAGWAHSILFTSDLRAFSTYWTCQTSSISSTESASIISPSRKRTRKDSSSQSLSASMVNVEATAISDLLPGSNEGTSLAERVKRRRRTIAVAT